MDLHFFDPNETAAILERRLPHWSQPGVVCFATFRTNDSMPAEVVHRWHLQRLQWLRDRGISCEDSNWRDQLADLSVEEQHEFYSTFSGRWHDELDCCRGACVLKTEENASVVADAFLRFDGDRYELCDFVVMPNHVHMLLTFPDDESMLKQFEDWTRYTARIINKREETSGRFWQQDGFDHLVRSEAQFHHFRRYIAANPKKAGLVEGEFLHWTQESSSQSQNG